jgi:hypothetical protein
MTASSNAQTQQQQPISESDILYHRMERKWLTLSMAEQRGQPTEVLTRLYDAYLEALDNYTQYCARLYRAIHTSAQ